jgi:hypothetical protein
MYVLSCLIDLCCGECSTVHTRAERQLTGSELFTYTFLLSIVWITSHTPVLQQPLHCVSSTIPAILPAPWSPPCWLLFTTRGSKRVSLEFPSTSFTSLSFWTIFLSSSFRHSFSSFFLPFLLCFPFLPSLPLPSSSSSLCGTENIIVTFIIIIYYFVLWWYWVSP